ncbi:MAG: polysaccharide deacetylase family protein [Lachnospiraceae bacterium]
MKYLYYPLYVLTLLTLSGCSVSFSAKPSALQSPLSSESKPNSENPEIIVYQDSSDAPAAITPLALPSEEEFQALSHLDNTMQSWGYSTKDRDANNRPNGSVQYQTKYASYNADFLGANEPTIYLTFDEGYENGYTSQILDILKEKQVSAVFFVTMPYVKENPDLIRRMIDEGHIIGNHSVSHPESGFPSLSLKQQAEEIIELHNYMLENFSYSMYLFRYPKGMFSEQSMALLQKMGYRTVFWSFAYKDWVTTAQPSQSEGLEKTTSQLHNGAIYLLHAVSSTNTAILPDFIDTARNKGFLFGVYK